MAEKTIEKFLARAVRLYEQEQEEPFGALWLLHAWIICAAVGKVGKTELIWLQSRLNSKRVLPAFT